MFDGLVNQCKSDSDKIASHQEYQIADKVLYIRFNQLMGTSTEFLPTFSDLLEITRKCHQ